MARTSITFIRVTSEEGIAGNYISSHFSAEDSDPKVQEFVKLYMKANHNEKPGAMAALGYDAILFAADAIKRAKELTPEGIKLAINQTKNFPGITGLITLDQNRNATKSAVILETTMDGFKFNAKVNP